MKKISVIILSYKQEQFIEKAIRGVYTQKGNHPIELIICDDCSPDKTDEVIQKTILNAPQNITVKYFSHPKNLGSTPNFYFALKQVTGKYLSFCEGDDYWFDENKLQIQYDFLEAHPDYSMCFHNVINISPDPIINNTPFSKIENRDYSAFEIYNNWLVHTTSVFMKTETLQNDAVKKTLVKTDLLYFDTILYMANSLSGKIRGLAETMTAYRRHEVGLSHGVNYKRDLRHNQLDQIIGDYYGNKIRESANWQIFSRSRIALSACLKNGQFILALKHLKWILKKKGNLKIYLIKKIK